MALERNKKEVKQLIGEASPEQIAEWKNKYKVIYIVVVEGHVLYLRKPDRAILAYASTAAKDGPFQYIEALMDNCKIGGSAIFDEDDDYYLAVMPQVEAIAELKKAEIVKL